MGTLGSHIGTSVGRRRSDKLRHIDKIVAISGRRRPCENGDDAGTVETKRGDAGIPICVYECSDGRKLNCVILKAVQLNYISLRDIIRIID